MQFVELGADSNRRTSGAEELLVTGTVPFAYRLVQRPVRSPGTDPDGSVRGHGKYIEGVRLLSLDRHGVRSRGKG